jgi:hypothetical protein
MGAEELLCHRCGASLAVLSLPLSRRDECPACRAELHVCRMCIHYAPRWRRGCDEDDAPDVRDKATANFCDYFVPSRNAFDAGKAAEGTVAQAELDKLFGGMSGGGDAPPDPDTQEPADDALRAAEALFKR